MPTQAPTSIRVVCPTCRRGYRVPGACPPRRLKCGFCNTVSSLPSTLLPAVSPNPLTTRVGNEVQGRPAALTLPGVHLKVPVYRNLMLLGYGGGAFLGLAAVVDQSMALLLFGLALVLVGDVTAIALLWRLWAAIQEGVARTTPGRAVGFCFIPFYNFYWVFQALPGWAEDYNKTVTRLGLRLPRVSEKPLRWSAIFSVLCVLPLIGLLFELIRTPLRVTAFLESAHAVNRLAEARTVSTAQNRKTSSSDRGRFN